MIGKKITKRDITYYFVSLSFSLGMVFAFIVGNYHRGQSSWIDSQYWICFLKDHTHDVLIDRPELYSIVEDIYQWMFETRNYWNERIPRLMDYYRKESEELQKEDPEYYWRYGAQYYTEENIHRRIYKRYRRECGYTRSHFHGCLAKS